MPPTPGQINADAKGRVQKAVIKLLRKNGPKKVFTTWDILETRNTRLRREMTTYGLASPQNKSKLKKIAFSENNVEEVMLHSMIVSTSNLFIVSLVVVNEFKKTGLVIMKGENKDIL